MIRTVRAAGRPPVAGTVMLTVIPRRPAATSSASSAREIRIRSVAEPPDFRR